MPRPLEQAATGHPHRVGEHPSIGGQRRQDIDALRVGQPGDQRPIGVQRIGQQQADAIRSVQCERLFDQLTRHLGLAAFFRGRSFSQPPRHDHRPPRRDTDQADQTKVVAQPSAIDRIDLTLDQLTLIQALDTRLLHP